MTLAVDASSPAAVVGSTTTTTTASFTPPANSLLVAFVMADANSGVTTEACTVTSTGGLTWTLAPNGRVNGSPGAVVEVWTAQAITSPGSITVSVTDSQGAVAKRLLVQVITDTTGIVPAGVGATTSTATTSAAYTSTQPGSWGWAVGLGGGGTPTAGASQTLADFDTAFDGGDGAWVLKRTAVTATAGTTVTMSVTAPATVVHHLAVEILPGIPAVYEVGTTTYTSANTATITTASFTPTSNTLLVAYVSMGNGLAVASSLGTVTDSLSGTWTRLAGEASASGGVAEVWARDIGTAAAMTVTYDPGGAGASGLDIICRWYAGAKPVASQPGATAVNGGGTSYSKAITTTTTGSLVAGSYGRATDSQVLTANTSTSVFGQFNGSGGDTAALFRATALTGTPGAVTLGFTNTPAGVNRIALAEILPASTAITAPQVNPYGPGRAAPGSRWTPAAVDSTQPTPPQFRDATANWGSAGSVTLTIPSTVQPGDVMVLVSSYKLTVVNGVTNTPTGWTPVDAAINMSGTSSNGSTFARVADATDAGSTLTVTGSGGVGQQMAVAVAAYSGASGLPTVHAWVDATAGTASTTITAGQQGLPLGGLAVGLLAVRSSTTGGQPTYTVSGAAAVRTQTMTTSGGAQNMGAVIADAPVSAGQTFTGTSTAWGLAGQIILAPGVAATAPAASGVTVVDTPVGVLGGGPGGTLTVDLLLADTAGDARGGQPSAETAAVGVTVADAPGGVLAGAAAAGTVVVGVTAADSAGTARGGGPAETVTAGVVVADGQATAARAGVASAETVTVGVTATDVPSTGRAGTTLETVVFGVTVADTTGAARGQVPAAETVSVGVTVADTAGAGRAGSSSETVAVGTAVADTPSAGRAGTPAAETVVTGITVTDQPTAVRGGTLAETVTEALIVADTTPSAARAGNGSETVAVGVTVGDVAGPGRAGSPATGLTIDLILADTTGVARAGTPAGETVTAGVTVADTASVGYTASTTETVTAGTTLADTPGTVRAGGPVSGLTVDQVIADLAGAGRAAATADQVTVDLLVGDVPTGGRGGGSTETAGASLQIVDQPSAARAGTAATGLTVDLVVADQPGPVRGSGPVEVVVYDLTVTDTPSAGRGGGGTETGGIATVAPDTAPAAVRAGTTTEQVVTGVTAVDNPATARASGPAETVTTGLTVTDAPTAGRAGGPVDGLAIGSNVTIADTPPVAAAARPVTDRPVVDMVVADTASLTRAGTTVSAVILAVLIADQPSIGYASGPGGTGAVPVPGRHYTTGTGGPQYTSTTVGGRYTASASGSRYSPGQDGTQYTTGSDPPTYTVTSPTP